MKDELHKKDLEVKRLHSHLNKSAANQMREEMAEMEVYVVCVGGGGDLQ